MDFQEVTEHYQYEREWIFNERLAVGEDQILRPLLDDAIKHHTDLTPAIFIRRRSVQIIIVRGQETMESWGWRVSRITEAINGVLREYQPIQ